MTIDLRNSTCRGGGAIWALLSHVRDLPPGDSIEILTDDYSAGTDIPSYVRRRHWTVARQQRRGYIKFVVGRPLASTD